MGAIMYSFNLNMSLKLLYGVLGCGSLVLNNYMLMSL